jgi:hypothetical protein
VSLEAVDYATAVQVLRDNSTVQLVVKRRVVLQEASTVRVSLSRKEGGSSGSGGGKKGEPHLCTYFCISPVPVNVTPGQG